MFERLLVPIGAGAESLLALPLACQLAEATGARLCLLRIALADGFATAGAGGDELPARRMAEGPICPGAFPPAEEVILRAERASDIPALIVAEAEARAADLIVMVTDARGGPERLTHPSVAAAVMESAPAPLLLLDAADGQLADSPAAPILVAIDGTPEGAAVLPVAVRYGRVLGAEVHLLRVVVPQLAGASPSDLRHDLAALGGAQYYVDQLAAQLNDCGVSVRGRAMFGSVAGTIAAAARRINAGAIAISPRELWGKAHPDHGSIVDELLRTAPCPVLVARRTGARASHQPCAAGDAPAAHPPAGASAARG